jgi:23S rRNA pseudouridine1911/1915/1917 synthase
MDNAKFFNAQNQDKGKRLDIFVFEKLNGLYSRSSIQRFIRQGFIVVSGKERRPNYHLKENDSACFVPPEKNIIDIIPENILLDIVYEDSDIIVINKRSGMVVHPASGNREHTLVNALLFHTGGQLANAGSTRPGIVHRLDKDVSGVMVAAKTDYAGNALINEFKRRLVKKTYIAFVEGLPAKDNMHLALPLGRSATDRKKMAVRFYNSKDAVTNLEVLKRFKDSSKARIMIETGRTHQIRVHMSYIGHPIIGDTKYGGRAFERIALYASELKFIHPRTKKDMFFTVGMPKELNKLEA